MLDQLQANLGKHLVVELVNGRKVSGTLVEANDRFIRMESEEGMGTIPYSAIQVIWENMNHTLNEENMDFIANQMRKEEESRISCTAVSGFICQNQYYCLPPDYCAYTFACPGIYSPSQPQGGCTYFFTPGCTYFFNQPCGFQFYQPCGFRFYFQPCGFRFTQPCYVPFQQPCAYPFGSQCTAPGGFTCPGQAFIGIAPQAAKKEKKE
ncbi:hypothetical protein JCM14036_11610 [Desulfotomaculum defluvii]